MGIHGKQATEEQVAFVKANYREKCEWLGCMTGMSAAWVCKTRRRLREQGEIGDDYARHHRWTEEDINILIAHAQLGAVKLVKLLPNHSRLSIETQRSIYIKSGLIKKISMQKSKKK